MIFNEDVIKLEKTLNALNKEKHLKGYMYDSLVYRYQLALYKANEIETRDLMINENLSRQEAETKARKYAKRDLMRFCQILDEAIGEHD